MTLLDDKGRRAWLTSPTRMSRAGAQRRAGELLGIPVLDHVVVQEKYYSFADSGW